MQLQNKVAIVTGGGRGIGRAYALALAAQGARVVVADVIDTAEAVADIAAAGGEALGLHCDVSDEASTLAMAEQATARFGGIDVLINNAAVFADIPTQSYDKIPVAEWDRVMAVNVRGAFLCSRAVIPAMRQRGQGKIINISSSTILHGTPFILHYVTSKGAIMAFTRALAREVGQWNICVNSVGPGLTMSEAVSQHPSYPKWDAGVVKSRCLQRSQSADDICGTIVYLASGASDFITGQFITVDGGTSMH